MPTRDIFDDLLDELGDLGDGRAKLLKELRAIATGTLVDEAAKVASRVVLKGIDGVIEAAVRNLPPARARTLADSFLTEVIGQQYDQLREALEAYVPLQLAVEVAKRQAGPTSAQANAARARRQRGIDELREEVRDLLRTAVGKQPTD